MPSVSQAQNRFVHAKASEGIAWAREWLKKDHGRKISELPERASHMDAMKRRRKGRTS